MNPPRHICPGSLGCIFRCHRTAVPRGAAGRRKLVAGRHTLVAAVAHRPVAEVPRKPEVGGLCRLVVGPHRLAWAEARNMLAVGPRRLACAQGRHMLVVEPHTRAAVAARRVGWQLVHS